MLFLLQDKAGVDEFKQDAMPFLVAYCLSFFMTLWLTRLPSAIWLAVLLPLFFAALIIHQCIPKRLIKKIAQAVIGFLVGYCWVTVYSYDQLSHRIPTALEGQQLLLNVEVSSLVIDKGRYQQLSATVLSSESQSLEPSALRKVLLNFYRPAGSDKKVTIKPCDTLRIYAKLKRPRGLINLAGFDYSQYLFEQGYDAKGYIQSIVHQVSYQGVCVQNLRQGYRDAVLKVLPTAQASWLLALTIGDKSTFSKQQKKLLVETGLSHLFVISGMHIGIIAGFVYWLVLIVRRLGGGLIFRGDWRFAAACCAIIGAFGYALLAGFGYSTQRALIAITAFMWVSSSRLHLSLWLRYWLAMAVTLTFSPLSPLNTGFILSFYAVFIIILVGQQVRCMRTLQQKLVVFMKIQAALFIGLLPLSLYYFQTLSLIAPLMNVWMIPLLSLLVTPLCLGAACLWFMGINEAYLLLVLGHMFDNIFYGVNWIVEHWIGEIVVFRSISFVQACGLIAGALMLCMPRFIPARLLACFVFLAVGLSCYFPKMDALPLRVDVLDVGQGTSVVIRTKHHSMLYDAGAGWGSGSMGAWVVVPVLRKMGIDVLDQVMISHLDNDHRGGLEDVLAAVDSLEVVSSENLPVDHFTTCQSKKSWIWDNVRFAIIHPKDFALSDRNNQSCVLQVTYQGKHVLLAGDIEKVVERQLVSEGQLSKLSVLLVPHHGSNTSSTLPFIELTKPDYAVVSSGYLNRYRHPSKKVLERYSGQDIPVFNTADLGGIRFSFMEDGWVRMSNFREREQRFWHE